MGVLSRSLEDRGKRASTGAGRRTEGEMQWRSQRVAELSAGIAHEVRNPLNAMAIHLEVLSDKLRDADGELPGTVRPNLEAIRSQIRRLDGIIRQFSDFAQGRAPGSDLEPIVEGAIELCSFPMRRMGMEVQLAPLPQTQVADGAALSLVLVEVLLLFVEAAEVGAKIRIGGSFENETIRLCFQSDASDMGVDPDRLQLASNLLEAQRGRLEQGAEPGTFAVLTIPRGAAAASP